MHSLLEKYLSVVEAQLSALPPKQRTEELREIAAHLSQAAFIHQEQGESEEEAVQRAIEQFGRPEEVSENVVWAWQRGVVLSRRSFWGAAVCVLALLFLTELSLGPLTTAYLNLVDPDHLLTVQWESTAFNMIGTILAGAVSGSLFSRRGIAGTALGVAAYSALCIVIYAHWLTQPGHMRLVEPLLRVAVALRFFIPLVVQGLLALLAAWLGNRLRLVKSKRGRLA